MILAEQLKQGIDELGLELSDDVQRKLLDYLALLEKWNKVYALTAIRDHTKMVSHHLLDCLAALPHVTAQRVLDVGSGGGQPGLVWAIARPDWSLTLLDSNHKKTTFLRQAVIDLGLSNVEVVTGRVEALTAEDPYDVITSRAFSDLGDFVRLSRALLADDGRWLAMKGVHPYEEIALLPKDIVVDKVVPLHVPGLGAERHLIIMQAVPNA
ncbi:16S rRNA (guanine527-N7)-methyltransferase [Chitinivorax tropicus]|uniref:Ribosomal RNA small subunit methyltransferase G n=1 Tax=Chitinivorax tropicus TaxID=714531 RepID=A0A840MI29_9PROT|nr:16S rRNA (guanine(527)-N(7))-methyltransferase RsmG [Chitinivorax tropicus]MBB5018060.1 16S rRNA (guanine527-N7)-methyltransferase [Chitinivorax tropicus]